jgi:hypothetical protein
MRNKIIIFTAIVGIGFLFSCKKDEIKTTIKNTPGNPSLTSPSDGTTKVLALTDSAKNILFTWTKADFGYDATVAYALQIDKSGNNFSKPSNIATTILADSASVNIYALDNILLTMGLPENQPATVEVRVRAIVNAINSSAFADTAISSVIKMSITPFLIIVNYPKLYVPGDQNSWSFTDYVYSVNSDNTYEGYVYFPSAGKFKLTNVAAWVEFSTFGDANSSGTSGKLVNDWGSNIYVSTAGYIKINADLNALTYSWINTSWAISGDFNGWKDTPMTYDVANKVWTVTTSLTSGGLKFKLNGDASWSLNYGDNLGNGKLQPGGANIAVPSAGNYTVTLNLSGAIYKYTLVKN